MSAGTAKPTTGPRCRFTDAYGHAGATRIFFGLCFGNDVLRLGEGHDTSRFPPATTAEGHREPCGKRQRRKGERKAEAMVAAGSMRRRLTPAGGLARLAVRAKQRDLRL